ncbi:hypothetical protein HK099_005773 [Clydaea vesicula]|uniref:Membrane anchor Opy2 N-terminal domain-containing protein n=1 Tax=Clydaea vesicula TaxID=447962 RepID=A0AAD5TYS0_9FUNG|nr:hypothetical protein HK099_005773 [Clydaea vesicula]
MQSKLFSVVALLIASASATPAIMCPQVMPSCDVVKCASGLRCEIFPQTKTTCAQAKCVKEP